MPGEYLNISLNYDVPYTEILNSPSTFLISLSKMLLPEFDSYLHAFWQPPELV